MVKYYQSSVSNVCVYIGSVCAFVSIGFSHVCVYITVCVSVFVH